MSGRVSNRFETDTAKNAVPFKRNVRLLGYRRTADARIRPIPMRSDSTLLAPRSGSKTETSI
jgi:hypothetical protein